MAKFKSTDDLNNLIQSAPQPIYGTQVRSVARPGEDLGKYDQGITMYDTPESRRELNYQNQTGWQAWGNAVGQSLAEVTAGTLEGFGYLLDFEQHVKALYGVEKEFDNEFSRYMRQLKESSREEMPIFTDPDKPFDPLNSRWWASNLPSIASIVTLMIPTGAAVGALGKFGKGLSKVTGLAKGVSMETKVLGGLTSGRAITSGAISRVLESTMEAAGNADQVYKELISQGKSEEEARTEAGKVASNTYYANLPLMLSDMFEYSVLFRNKGVDNAVDALNKQTKKSLLKNSLAVGGSFVSEGLEEGYQYGVGQEAKKSKNAGETMSNVVNNFGEYFDDPEFLSSIVVGGMSGAGFQALGNVIESRSAKLANIFPEFDDTALQGLVASTGKSASSLKTSAQAAFTKFKGNLQEALANTEEAVKSLPEDQREIYKLGLDVLKNTSTPTSEDNSTMGNLWNGAKEKINTAITRIKKWSGINEKIQQLEATGNEVQAEILKKSEFIKLVEVNTPDAEKYMEQAKEAGIDITEYEEILDTYKEGLVQHQGNTDAAKVETEAEIRRQAYKNQQYKVAKFGSIYNDFDLNSLREEYLDKEGSSEAKILKSGIEPDKTKNKTISNNLKKMVKQLVDLELEQVRLTKQADKLDTKAGKEEHEQAKRQELVDSIKSSTDPEVLFNEYGDEELDNLVKERKNKLFKEEIARLPNPNDYLDYDSFKEAVTAKDYLVIGSTKNTAKIDAKLIEYYNKEKRENTPTPDVFEETEFEKTLPDTPIVKDDLVDEPSPLEIDSELQDFDTLNEEVAAIEHQGDFMLHSQLWDMGSLPREDGNKYWEDRKFIKDRVTGNNKYSNPDFRDWTDNSILTEQFFNNIGDYRDHKLFFEATNVQFKERRGKIAEVTKDNVPIRVYTIWNGQKVYVGQLQRTSQTIDKSKTNTKALDELKEKAFKWYKTSKVGDKLTFGETHFTNYEYGFYNNLAAPRDVKEALTDEEKDNIGIGVYMGENEEMGLMKTNRPDMVDIKPGKAKPGSVFIAKKVPSGGWRWFGARTKKLSQMPELVQQIREILAPFVQASINGKKSEEYKYIAREDFIKTTLGQLRSIVRYKVDGKLEPDFNEKLINVKIYQTDGVFDIDKFISVNNLLDRPVQIDPKQLSDQNYIDSILNRLETDIDIIPIVNPFFAVAPLGNVQIDVAVRSETSDWQLNLSGLTVPVEEVTSTDNYVKLQRLKKELEDVKSDVKTNTFSNLTVRGNNLVYLQTPVNGKFIRSDSTLIPNKTFYVLNQNTGEFALVEDTTTRTTAFNIPDTYLQGVERLGLIEPSNDTYVVSRLGKAERIGGAWEIRTPMQIREANEVVGYDKVKAANLERQISQLENETFDSADIDFDVDIDDTPKFMLATRENSRKLNPEQAVKNLRRIIPNVYTVKVVEGLIKEGDVEAYGMVYDSAVTLSELAPEGTEYHEAYHVIESILPKWQLKQVQKIGTEEERADAFMGYMETKQTRSDLRKFFDNIIAFIKDILKFNVDILDIFDRIDSGYYKNWKPKYLAKRFMLAGFTAKQKDDLLNLYLGHVNEMIDLSVKENVESMINPDPAWNRFTSLAAKSPLHLFLVKVYKQAGLDKTNEILKVIREDAELKVVDGLVLEENKSYDSSSNLKQGKLKITQGTPKFGKLYPELLKSLGKRGYKIVLGQIELRELHQTEPEGVDYETDSLEGWQESASLRSPAEKLSKRMKQLIYSVKSDKQDSVGLGMNLNYNGYEAYARLASVIVDSIDVQDMMAKINGRTETFFVNLREYINTKFKYPENTWTELYKALGDKTQPKYWVLVEEAREVNGEKNYDYKVIEANQEGLKSRIKKLAKEYVGSSQDFLNLVGLEDLNLKTWEMTSLEGAIKVENPKQRQARVWDFLKNKVASNVVNAHLNVEGKRQYEIINGGFLSKLLQRLQRDFKNTVNNIYSQDKTLSKLPILSNPKPRDFEFVQFAGFKSADGEGTMYNNYNERQFILSTFWAWQKEKVFAMPILSDSPNLVGVRYQVPKELNVAKEIAKLIHLEVNRLKNNFGIKNYTPDQRAIWGDIEYNENLIKQEIIVSKHFQAMTEQYKDYAKENYASVQWSDVNQYLLEHAYVHVQMSMLTIGDLAFYKNLEDYYKRAKEIWSPVVKGNVDNFFIVKRDGETPDQAIRIVSKRQRTKVLESKEVPSNQIDDLRKIESIPSDAYEKVDKTDAQTYIDMIAYRDRLIYLEEWTDRHNSVFDQLVRGEIPTEDITGLFNVLKPFYYNLRVVREDTPRSTESVVVPTQKKDSELLILPIYGLETLSGKPNKLYNPLWRQHLIEMGYNFDTMSYDMQGRREGKYYDVITYDTTIKVGKKDELYFNLSDWGKQQETPEHHYMSDAIFGTQLMKLITGNLEGSYTLASGEVLTARELWVKYNDLIVQWIYDNYDELIQKYGSVEKIKKMAVEEMINKGMRDDYIKSVQSLPITHPVHFNKLVQVINSFAKNNVTDLTFDKGVTFANASSEGFVKQPVIKWNNDDSNQGIKHFEVIAPIHDKRILAYLVDGQVDMNRLQEDIDAGVIPNLLEGLVYRIPTEGKYSMFKIKIVQFLLVDNGVVFMPDMVTKIAGLDFDIDKVRGFFYGGSRNQDKILDLMMAVLSSPQALTEQLTPGGFDNLKDNNRYLRGYKAGIAETDELMKTESGKKKLDELLKDKLSFYSPITLSKIAKRMNVGKALIGTAANTNAVHALMEAFNNFTGTTIDDGVEVIYDGNSLVSMSGKYDTQGNLISSNIAELLAAFVDNGKDPQAEYSNISSDTIAVGLYLLKKGIPLKSVQFFLTQVTDIYAPYDPELRPVFNSSELEDSLRNEPSSLWNSLFALVRGKARKLEDFVGAVKVANAGAGATMVDNYIKIKKLREDPYYDMLRSVHENLAGEEHVDTTLTEALINKGLIEWNRYMVSEFGIPDVEKGTVGKVMQIMTEQVYDRLTNDEIKNVYNSFLTYIASDYFKYDQKLVDNLHEKLNQYKIDNADNKFLQRLKMDNGFIQFAGSNTNDELEIQSIIDSWVELMQDEKTAKTANDLVKYAFYTKGFDFGMGSFGHLIPLYYYEHNPDFTDMYVKRLKELDQSNGGIAKSFIEQYIMNNYYTVKLKEAEGTLDGKMLRVAGNVAVGNYRAEYVRSNGFIYKYAGENTYQQIGSYGKYVPETKIKRLQRYFYGAKTIETQIIKTEKKYEPVEVSSQEKVMIEMRFEEEQSSGYRERTIKNASADATIAFASDFTTAGEKLTKNSVEGQKKKYIPINTKNLTVTPERVAGIVSRLNSVNAKTLNIAGNGIYSLPYTQEQVDEFTYQLLKAVLESPDLKNKIESIRSGGQTGFDEAGVKAGQKLGIPTLVLAPKGWKFRNKQGQDISNEQQFKSRFNVQIQPSPQLDMFKSSLFTQQDADKLNEIISSRYTGSYTVEQLNNLAEDVKEKVRKCLLTGKI